MLSSKGIFFGGSESFRSEGLLDKKEKTSSKAGQTCKLVRAKGLEPSPRKNGT